MKIRDRIKSLRRVKASELRPHPANWRTHPDSQRDALRGMLAEIGFADVVLARELPDKTLELIDGHLRAELTPDQKIPVLILDVTEDEARKLLATLDPLAGMAEADPEAVARLVGEIDTESEALQALLDQLESEAAAVEDSGPNNPAEDTQPQDPGAQMDKAEQLRKKWKTEPGQLWVIPGKMGKHRLFCGDATKEKDVKALFGKGVRAPLMHTDPPYGIDYAATKQGMPINGLGETQSCRGDIKNDDLTDPAALQAFLEKAIRTALPRLTEDPAFYLWYVDLSQGTFFAAAAAAAADILIHRQIIWVKPNQVLTRSGQYHWKHELCFYGWIRGKPCPWYGSKSQVSVWECGEGTAGRLHHTQKPVELFIAPLLNHTREAEVAYDPFLGSGSQMIAAEHLGRLCYGMEIEPKYAAVTLQRMADLGLTPKRA